MRINDRSLIISAALSSLLLLSGCGPGFPIMTAEQESLVKNVDALMKDNDALKKRVASLEGSKEAGDKAAADGVESLRASVAETNSVVDKMRQELSFVQGSVETSDHERSQIKESVGALEAAVSGISGRLAALEGSSKESDARIAPVKASLAVLEKTVGELKDSVAALDAKFSSAGAKAPAGAKDATAKKEPKIDPEALYLKGYRETLEKDYAKATETFLSFLSEYPDHKFAGNAQYWIGEIYYAKGDWEKAIIEFDKAIKKYPKSDKLAASILKQGFSFERLGSRKEARVLLEEVIEKYPKSPEAGLAKKKLEDIK